MKRLFLVSAATVAIGGTAYAAEPLEPIAPPPPPVVEPVEVFTWAGPYIGADIGWGWADFDRERRRRVVGEREVEVEVDERDRGKKGKKGKKGDNGGRSVQTITETESRELDIFLNGDNDDLDGLVGGLFAGWLGQRGNFLFGAEIFGQFADIDHDRHRRLGDVRVDGDECFVDQGGVTWEIGCPALGAREVRALFGLEGMIGWGAERAAFLLHAGPALGWFKNDRDRFGAVAFRDDDDDIELGLSVAAEGRFKLTETVFAGVIGRAFWFPDVGDDNERVVTNGLVDRRHGDGDDVTVFEVKARIGMMFGRPPVAAPIEAAF